MEHEDAVGEVVGLHGARKVEHVIDGTREYTYVDDQLALFIDRDPKYKLDLEARSEIQALRAVLAVREHELYEIKGPCSNSKCRLHYAHSGPCAHGRILKNDHE